VCNSLNRHSEEVRSGAARKLRRARKVHEWWRQKNKERVKSKKPRSPPYKASCERDMG
jgi:hypothetical protein